MFVSSFCLIYLWLFVTINFVILPITFVLLLFTCLLLVICVPILCCCFSWFEFACWYVIWIVVFGLIADSFV